MLGLFASILTRVTDLFPDNRVHRRGRPGAHRPDAATRMLPPAGRWAPPAPIPHGPVAAPPGRPHAVGPWPPNQNQAGSGQVGPQVGVQAQANSRWPGQLPHPPVPEQARPVQPRT